MRGFQFRTLKQTILCNLTPLSVCCLLDKIQEKTNPLGSLGIPVKLESISSIEATRVAGGGGGVITFL